MQFSPATPPHLSTALTLIRRRSADSEIEVDFTLSLTADDRMRSRHYFESVEGHPLYLNLPRGTLLHHGDVLEADDDQRRVRVIAKPEPLMVVTGNTPLDLLRATYHLGNRHVALELTVNDIRLAPDPVLKTMLEHLGLRVVEEVAPFHPEAGAYGHLHTH
ncbi:MAG TPA: urease accessory protein UreE [Elainellaceae cyanobacterium]|jgi:urease accessory protein